MGEGLVYVKTGEAAVISGNITANAFTKFGKGTLTLSGTNMITGDFSVQDGTVKLGSGNVFSSLNSELNINAGATLDLNGNNTMFETIGANNRLVATAAIGGTVTNSSGTVANLGVAGSVNSAFNGVISGNVRLLKAGTGVLTINGYSSSSPDSGSNTYTGGTDIYGSNATGGGGLTINNATFGLGGAAGGTPDVNLYGGTLSLQFSNGTTGVNGTHGMQFNNMVVRHGADGTDGVTLNVRGPSIINVNVATPSSATAFGQGNIMQVGAMNLSNTTLQIQGGNLYRFRAAGPIAIQGSQAAIQTNSDGPNGIMELYGVVSGAGALTKLGDGTMRGFVLNNPGNTYSGGTNIVAGDVQVTATTGTPLGSGPVRIFPDGTLRIAGNGSVNPANLITMSRVNALAAVVIDDNFNPTVLNSTNFSSVYNTTLQLGQVYFNQALDMSTIGDGRAFLGTGLNAEVHYTAPTLGAGVPDAWNPGVGVYRLVGGAPITNSAPTLSLAGIDNVLTGANFLQVGPQRNSAVGAATNTGGTVSVRNLNNFTGGTQIAEGVTLAVETGGAVAGGTPLGTGAVEVYGELRVRGTEGSFWNAATSAPNTTINLRPGGTVRIHDAEGAVNAGLFLGAGGQGRWGDTVGLDLNGGNFIYNGGQNLNSVETMGAITARKGGTIQLARNTAASSVQLNVSDIARTDRGVLTIGSGAGFLGINATTPLSYERLTAASIDGAPIVRSGTTTGGAGVVNQGIVAPWIIDRGTASFVGYDPTGAGTGFQPLTSTTLPATGMMGYSKVITASPITTLVAGDTVDITTAAMTLGQNPSIHALRSNQNISPTATFNSVTIESGGLIMSGGIINPTGAVTAGVLSPMTLNFGAGGSGEAFVYASAASTIQAQIKAAAGFTKFGPSSVQINSINPDIDAPVVVNEGVLVARVPFSGTGTPIGSGNGVFGGQDVILNAGTLQLDPFMANSTGTGTEIASNVRATALFDSNIIVRGDAGLNNNGQANFVRIKNLTFENAAGAAAMNGNGVITLALQSGVWVDGTTTLIPQAMFNMTVNSGLQSTFAGPVVENGTSDLEKFGNGTMTFLNPNNSWTGGTKIWGSTNNTAASTVASGVRGAGTPFGSGPITAQPGGLLRIADNANLASNAVTLRSDGVGLAGLGLAHNGALPTIITSGTPTAGQIKVETTGPFGAVLALDYGFYSQDINLGAIGNGDWWLGNSQQAEAFYFNDTLGANSNGKYQIGGGGNQSGINFGSVLVSGGRTPLFENIFSGGTAGQPRVEIGAQTGDFAWNSPSFVNGNSGFQVMVTRNTGLVGDTRVNTNTTLAIGNNFALGSGRLVLNGGNLRYDFGPNNLVGSNITLDNDVVLQGDWSTAQANELVLNGNIAMSDVLTSGATRVWNLTGTGAMAVGLTAGSATQGVISGALGSNLIKRGAQQLSLRGVNTYEGYTSIERGQIVVVGDVLPGLAGPLGVSDSPIVLGVESTNNVGALGIGGKFTIGRDIVVAAAPGTGVNLIEGRTNEIARLTGGISVSTGAILTLGAVGNNNATGQGGRLEILGPISGPGAVVFGSTLAATSFGGTVALLGSSNGFGTSTYTGGTTFQNTRVEIGSDTYFTNTSVAPTIISGPFGTGAMTWNNGEGANSASFLAVGGPRTIVNAFNPTASASDATFKFQGNQALTFTRDWNVNSDATLRSRAFQVNNPYQPVTFSGNLSASGAAGVTINKTGPGLLILGGTNTFATSATTGVLISSGVLRVATDAALGAGTGLRMAGGTLSVSDNITTARVLTMSVNSGIDVASGKTLALTANTAGAFGITKTGPGTLALNGTATTINNLVIGGQVALNPVTGYYSNTGGTVSTTAASGTPFATTSVAINGGTLALADAAAQTLSIPTITYGAGAQISLGAGDALTASTALTRVGGLVGTYTPAIANTFGTLVINPSSLAALGSTDKLIVTAGAPANTTLSGGDILTVPSVFAALAGPGQDANFTRYVAGNGFAEHNVPTVATLAASAATNVGDITVADVAGAGVIDVGALRVAANVTPTDVTTLIRIANGGMIFNGATAPIVSAPVRFGTGT